MLRYVPEPSSKTADAAASAVWIDALDADEGELAQIEDMLGRPAPSRAQLSEIERSSRLQVHDGVLSMSVPLISHAGTGEARVAPVGFLLSQSRLVTLRYADLGAFTAVAQRFSAPGAAPSSGLQVFVALCDEIIDRLADSLEQAAAELRALSTTIFHAPDSEGRKAVRSNRVIREQLRQAGRLGDRVSDTRDALLGIGRAVDFACELTAGWCDGEFEGQLRSLRQDVVSLDDYEGHLSNKIQFLLDAMVGLIGIAQNDVFKFLTIVSIVGIPPTLVAGIYGMNFKAMPEYDWALGYPWALGVIVLSAVLPLAWFKWRGWF